MPDITDHDILTTLSADFRNMKESQDRFHVEMKSSIDDLKNNWSLRLEGTEKKAAAMDIRIGKLENRQIYYLGAGAVIIIVGLAIWQLFLPYISSHVGNITTVNTK